MTWDQAARTMADVIAAAESTLEGSDWVPPAPEPAIVIRPSSSERAVIESLLTEAHDLVARLDARARAVRAELDRIEKLRTAATAYIRHDR